MYKYIVCKSFNSKLSDALLFYSKFWCITDWIEQHVGHLENGRLFKTSLFLNCQINRLGFCKTCSCWYHYLNYPTIFWSWSTSLVFWDRHAHTFNMNLHTFRLSNSAIFLILYLPKGLTLTRIEYKLSSLRVDPFCTALLSRKTNRKSEMLSSFQRKMKRRGK